MQYCSWGHPEVFQVVCLRQIYSSSFKVIGQIKMVIGQKNKGLMRNKLQVVENLICAQFPQLLNVLNDLMWRTIHCSHYFKE